MKDSRKRKSKHLKLQTIGGHTSVQLLHEWVVITVRVPRRRLTKRLAGHSLQYLKRIGLVD